MPFVSVNEFETRLQWRVGEEALLSADATPSISVSEEWEAGDVGPWHPEALLVGAVESRTLFAFLRQAQAERVEVLFYQSSATARRVETAEGPHYTDLIVRPHVAVRTEEQVEVARRIFDELPEQCFPSSMLHLTPRIEPHIDAWDSAPVQAALGGQRVEP